MGCWDTLNNFTKLRITQGIIAILILCINIGFSLFVIVTNKQIYFNQYTKKTCDYYFCTTIEASQIIGFVTICIGICLEICAILIIVFLIWSYVNNNPIDDKHGIDGTDFREGSRIALLSMFIANVAVCIIGYSTSLGIQDAEHIGTITVLMWIVYMIPFVIVGIPLLGLLFWGICIIFGIFYAEIKNTNEIIKIRSENSK